MPIVPSTPKSTGGRLTPLRKRLFTPIASTVIASTNASTNASTPASTPVTVATVVQLQTSVWDPLDLRLAGYAKGQSASVIQMNQKNLTSTIASLTCSFNYKSMANLTEKAQHAGSAILEVLEQLLRVNQLLNDIVITNFPIAVYAEKRLDKCIQLRAEIEQMPVGSEPLIEEYLQTANSKIAAAAQAGTPTRGIKSSYKADYYSEFVAYKKRIEAVNLKKKEADEEEMIQHVYAMFSQAILNLSTKIVGFVKSADISPLTNELSGSVVLPATSEHIVSPLTHGNVSGIYAMLLKLFRDPAFVNFTNALTKIMHFSLTPEEAQLQPFKLKNFFIGQLDMWDRLRYFEYFNKDRFMTGVMIKSLPKDCSLRRELVNIVGTMDTPENESDPTMPLFHSCIRHLDNFEDSNKLQTTTSSKQNKRSYEQFAEAHCASNNNHYGYTANIRQSGLPVQSQTDGLLLKKRVVVNAPAQSHNSHNSQQQTGNQTFIAPTHKPKLVTREMNIKVRDNERDATFDYSSTPTKCNLCLNRLEGSHKPNNCYGGQCRKCGYHGHRSNTCLSDELIHTST